MKKLTFEDGDVFEIFLSKKLSAYCRVIGRNKWSPLFELFRGKIRAQLDLDTLKTEKPRRAKVLYLNKYSLKDKKKSRFLGNLPLSTEDKGHPPFFRGDPHSFWTVTHEDKVERVSPEEITYVELLAKGYFDLTIFASESVVAFYLKNKPLVFPPHLKACNKRASGKPSLPVRFARPRNK